MLTDKPTALYPTIIDGFVSGNILRLESLDGSTLEVSPFMAAVPYAFPGVDLDNHGFVLKNAGPFIYGKKQWCVTHLQKYSTRGWLKTSPDCYHQWWFWKLQQKNSEGTWLPGTERGIYFRKPFSWRWQADAKDPWVFTKGYLGGHWD